MSSDAFMSEANHSELGEWWLRKEVGSPQLLELGEFFCSQSLQSPQET